MPERITACGTVPGLSNSEGSALVGEQVKLLKLQFCQADIPCSVNCILLIFWKLSLLLFFLLPGKLLHPISFQFHLNFQLLTDHVLYSPGNGREKGWVVSQVHVDSEESAKEILMVQLH